MKEEGKRTARRVQDSLVDEYELLHAAEMGRKRLPREQDEGFDPDRLRIDWESLDRAASATTPVQWIERWVKATPGWLWLLTAAFTTLAAFGTFLWASHEFPAASVTQKLMLFGVCIVAFGLAGLLLALVATGMESPLIPSPQDRLRVALTMVVAMLGAGSLAAYGGNLWVSGTEDSLRKNTASIRKLNQEFALLREEFALQEEILATSRDQLISTFNASRGDSHGDRLSQLTEQIGRLRAEVSSTKRDLNMAQVEARSELTAQIGLLRERLETRLTELERDRLSSLARLTSLEEKLEEFRKSQTKLSDRVEEIEIRLKDKAPLTTSGLGIGDCIELTVSTEPGGPRKAMWSGFKALARLNGLHSDCIVWEPDEFKTTDPASITRMGSAMVLGNVGASGVVADLNDPLMASSSDFENLKARILALESQVFLLRLENASTVTEAKPPKPEDQ